MQGEEPVGVRGREEHDGFYLRVIRCRRVRVVLGNCGASALLQAMIRRGSVVAGCGRQACARRSRTVPVPAPGDDVAAASARTHV